MKVLPSALSSRSHWSWQSSTSTGTAVRLELQAGPLHGASLRCRAPIEPATPTWRRVLLPSPRPPSPAPRAPLRSWTPTVAGAWPGSPLACAKMRTRARGFPEPCSEFGPLHRAGSLQPVKARRTRSLRQAEICHYGTTRAQACMLPTLPSVFSACIMHSRRGFNCKNRSISRSYRLQMAFSMLPRYLYGTLAAKFRRFARTFSK